MFRQGPDLLVLFTRVDWEPNGDPHVPGNLEVWKQILRQKTDSKMIRDWAKRARGWNHPEELLEGMTALSRVVTDCGPLQSYLMASELDSARPPERRLSPETVRLLADRFSEFSSMVFDLH